MNHPGYNDWQLLVIKPQCLAKARPTAFHLDVFNIHTSDYDSFPYFSQDLVRRSSVTGGLVQK